MADAGIIDNKSARFLDQLEKEAKKILAKVGKETVATAQDNAPELSGRLKKSISYTVRYQGNDIVLKVGSSDFKANWMEFGTEKMRPKPFLQPATEELQRRFAELLKEAASRIKG